ncbi:hypothetical protein EGO58_12065, partial [Limosilactobacillus reuteri]
YIILRTMEHHTSHPEDGGFPYGRILTRIFEFFGVDLGGEEGKTPADRFDRRNLLKMGLQTLMDSPPRSGAQRSRGRRAAPMEDVHMEEESSEEDEDYVPQDEEDDLVDEDIPEEVPQGSRGTDPGFTRAAGPQHRAPPPESGAYDFEGMMSTMRALKDGQDQLLRRLDESASREEHILERQATLENSFLQLGQDLSTTANAMSADFGRLRRAVWLVNARFDYYDHHLDVNSRPPANVVII